VRGLSKRGVDVTLVLPFACETEHAKSINAYDTKTIKSLKIRKVDSILSPYLTSEQYELERKGEKTQYASSLIEEVKRFAQAASEIAQEEQFDVIHAHDWLTYEAGIKAKEISNKPLVVHVHATEFDRCGGENVNSKVYEIEKKGLKYADLVFAVSNFTKEKIMKYYGINSDKIMVVHNAIDPVEGEEFNFPLKEHYKFVLFLGRITIQKGPEYFVYMARKVLDYEPNTKFIVSGNGDMERFMMNEVARLGMLDKFIFTGFTRGKDVEKLYKISDVFVIPSVSEPFGLTALEAASYGVPVVLSKQTGVSEIMSHVLKVDFWDTEEMANKTIALLKYPMLHECLKEHAQTEIKKRSWEDAAEQCKALYQKAHQSW
jgi:glycosyltransferase involved in cell wall biosynthesis